jgi:hypothetical protein
VQIEGWSSSCTLKAFNRSIEAWNDARDLNASAEIIKKRAIAINI